ncbi:hypothetical protein JOD67_007056 [Tenggerimyces flavus]|nr:hypothetical protein [Tenggerimyces flavus]
MPARLAGRRNRAQWRVRLEADLRGSDQHTASLRYRRLPSRPAPASHARSRARASSRRPRDRPRLAYLIQVAAS